MFVRAGCGRALLAARYANVYRQSAPIAVRVWWQANAGGRSVRSDRSHLLSLVLQSCDILIVFDAFGVWIVPRSFDTADCIPSTW